MAVSGYLGQVNGNLETGVSGLLCLDLGVGVLQRVLSHRLCHGSSTFSVKLVCVCHLGHGPAHKDNLDNPIS
jgi:hypothetical protein